MSDEDMSLRLVDVSRRFGDRVAVASLSLSVPRGQIVVLLGHNGAGKTTTVRMAATLLSPDSGNVWVDGIDAVQHPRAARGRTGLVLGGDKGFYTRSSATTNLMFYADVAWVPGRDRRRRVEESLAAVGLSDRAGSRVGEFSRGMVQRLHIARALLSEPRLLILDEPSTGLDVQATRDLRELVRGRANAGVGVLLTTHSMTEAQVLADRIDVIRAGSLVVSGTTADVALAAGVSAVTTVLHRGSTTLAPELRQVPGVSRVDSIAMHGQVLDTVIWAEAPEPARIRRIAGPSAQLATREPTLEESYLALGESAGSAL